MLHIILSILKIILLLLAGLIALILALIALVLFVPLRYRLDASVKNGVQAAARVSWLFHFVTVRAEYLDNGLSLSVKLLGFSLIGEKPSGDHAKPEEDTDGAPVWEEADETIMDMPCDVKIRPAPTIDPFSAGPGTWEEKPAAASQPARKPLYKKRKKLTEKLAGHSRAFTEKIRKLVRKFREKIQSFSQRVCEWKERLDLYRRLWYEEHTQRAYRHVKKEFRYLLRHWFPRKIEGNVLFGLADPAQTGQLLGILCMVQAFSGNRFYAEADFQEPKFEGTVLIKGHARICHLLRAGLALLLDRHVRITFRRVRKLRG